MNAKAIRDPATPARKPLTAQDTAYTRLTLTPMALARSGFSMVALMATPKLVRVRNRWKAMARSTAATGRTRV
ncbi:hypothetical protein D1872_299590 [compost metagenome]